MNQIPGIENSEAASSEINKHYYTRFLPAIKKQHLLPAVSGKSCAGHKMHRSAVPEQGDGFVLYLKEKSDISAGFDFPSCGHG